MRLHPIRRNLVVFSSSADQVGRYDTPVAKRMVHTGRSRGAIRTAALLTVIAVRPRWRPLLAGVVLTTVGAMERGSAVGVVLILGLLLLWHAVMICADPDVDRKRRCQLERELAAYSSPAQRCDLEASVDRYPDCVTHEIRDILARQAMAANRNGTMSRA